MNETAQSILDIAAKQMHERLGVLESLIGEKGLGIEGWFRVELFHALKLNGIYVNIRNKGPDLDFGNFKLELKVAQTSPAGWIRTQGLVHAGVDCLFMGPFGLIETLKPDHYRRVGEKWMVGLLKNGE